MESSVYHPQRQNERQTVLNTIDKTMTTLNLYGEEERRITRVLFISSHSLKKNIRVYNYRLLQYYRVLKGFDEFFEIHHEPIRRFFHVLPSYRSTVPNNNICSILCRTDICSKVGRFFFLYFFLPLLACGIFLGIVQHSFNILCMFFVSFMLNRC